MPKFPIVSIVMPVYNAENYLDRSIGSIIGQSFSDWELVAVDDFSQDRSPDLLNKYSQADSRIRHLGLEINSGAAAARNLSIVEAKGRYLAFLDADDEWDQNKLERQLEFMKQTSAAISCTAYRRLRSVDNKVCDCRVPETLNYKQLLKNNVVGTSTLMLDTVKVGNPTMPPLRMRQDFAYWLQILKQQKLLHGLDEILTTYHANPHSISASKTKAAKATWRLFRDHLKLPLGDAIVSFGYYSFHSFGRNRYR